MPPQKRFMHEGRMEEAKTSLNKYLQTFPEGAFSFERTLLSLPDRKRAEEL